MYETATSAFKLGYSAYGRVPAETNPYTDGTYAYYDWQSGHDQAEHDFRNGFDKPVYSA